MKFFTIILASVFSISVTAADLKSAGDIFVSGNIQHVGDLTNEISFASATQDFRTNNSCGI